MTFTNSLELLTNDKVASAYVANRQKDLQALQADLGPCARLQAETNLGYATVTKTATGWLVNRLPAVSFVAVQAFILARYW